MVLLYSFSNIYLFNCIIWFIYLAILRTIIFNCLLATTYYYLQAHVTVLNKKFFSLEMGSKLDPGYR